MESIFPLASIVLLACHIVITIRAFQDEVFQGVMCLIVPGWIIYYGFRRLNLPGRGLFVLVYMVSAGIYLWGRFGPLIAGGPDACTLLTAQDAAEYLGGPVDAPTRKTIAFAGSAASSCMYATKSKPVREFGAVYSTGCKALPRSTERMTESLGLRGISDEAYVARGQVLARKGTVCVGIVTRDTTGGLEATMAREQLAKKMLERARKLH